MMVTRHLVELLLALAALSRAHDHADNAGYQEPFIGWTQADLDAKWGTDVSEVFTRHPKRTTDNVVVGILRHLNLCTPSACAMPATSGRNIRYCYSGSSIRHSSDIPARSTLWTSIHSCSFSTTDFVPWLQSTSWNQPVPRMGQGDRLW
jgi:hypothetical protein